MDRDESDDLAVVRDDETDEKAVLEKSLYIDEVDDDEHVVHETAQFAEADDEDDMFMIHENHEVLGIQIR